MHCASLYRYKFFSVGVFELVLAKFFKKIYYPYILKYHAILRSVIFSTKFRLAWLGKRITIINDCDSIKLFLCAHFIVQILEISNNTNF